MGVVYVHVYVWRPDEGALTLEEDLLREGYSYTVVGFQLKIFVFMVESFRRLSGGGTAIQRIIGLKSCMVTNDRGITFQLA